MEIRSEKHQQKRKSITDLIEFYKEYFLYRFKEVDVRYYNGSFIFDYRKSIMVDTLTSIFEVLDNPKRHTPRELEYAKEELERRKAIAENTLHYHFRSTYSDFQAIEVDDIEIHINGRLFTTFTIDPGKIPVLKRRFRKPREGLL